MDQTTPIQDYTVRQGETLRLGWLLRDQETQEPLDLTGVTVALSLTTEYRLREQAGTVTPVLALTATPTVNDSWIAVTDAVTGEIAMDVDAADVALLPPTTLMGDLKLAYPDGDVEYPFALRLLVEKRITA